MSGPNDVIEAIEFPSGEYVVVVRLDAITSVVSGENYLAVHTSCGQVHQVDPSHFKKVYECVTGVWRVTSA